MILDIDAHSCSVSDFAISSQGGAVGRASGNFQFTAYSSYPIELKLARMILDISVHNRYEQDFLVAQVGFRISKFFADVICICSPVSPSQKSLSLRSER